MANWEEALFDNTASSDDGYDTEGWEDFNLEREHSYHPDDWAKIREIYALQFRSTEEFAAEEAEEARRQRESDPWFAEEPAGPDEDWVGYDERPDQERTDEAKERARFYELKPILQDLGYQPRYELCHSPRDQDRVEPCWHCGGIGNERPTGVYSYHRRGIGQVQLTELAFYNVLLPMLNEAELQIICQHTIVKDDLEFLHPGWQYFLKEPNRFRAKLRPMRW